MVERIGLDHTKQLWALSEQGLDYVRRTIHETGMPGVDPVSGWLHISKTDNGDQIDAEVERLRWIGANVEAWPTERVREVLPNPPVDAEPLKCRTGLQNDELRGHISRRSRCDACRMRAVDLKLNGSGRAGINARVVPGARSHGNAAIVTGFCASYDDLIDPIHSAVRPGGTSSACRIVPHADLIS